MGDLAALPALGWCGFVHMTYFSFFSQSWVLRVAAVGECWGIPLYAMHAKWNVCKMACEPISFPCGDSSRAFVDHWKGFVLSFSHSTNVYYSSVHHYVPGTVGSPILIELTFLIQKRLGSPNVKFKIPSYCFLLLFWK